VACGDPAGEHPFNAGVGNGAGAASGGSTPGAAGTVNGTSGNGPGVGGAPGSGGSGPGAGGVAAGTGGSSSGKGGGSSTGGSGPGGNCLYPVVSSEIPKAHYSKWKETHVVAASGALRVQRPQDANDTVSEGIAYGMLIAVYLDDQPTFDGLWAYSQKYLNSNGFMHWRIDSGGNVTGQNGATDSDEDMAWALLIAAKKWGGNYQQLATALIEKIWQHEVEKGSFVLKPGDQFGGSSETNPSYFAPAYYKVFATVTGNAEWTKVVDSSYSIINSSMNSTTGLVPDWTSGGSDRMKYKADAARTPWRIAMDACWNAEPRAVAYLTKISAFFAGLGPTAIKDGYELNGTALPNTNSNGMAFIGPAGVGAMAANKGVFADQAYATVYELMGRSDSTYSYYNATVGLLSLLMFSGTMTPP
jgi:endo-1,4-beta-D-glucanase Y